MKKTIIITIIIATLLLAGCAKPISEVKSDEYVGETVTVKGVVSSTTKIGDISGYALTDKEGESIIVASERLPAEGDRVRVKGEVKEGLLGIGYYIDADQ